LSPRRAREHPSLVAWLVVLAEIALPCALLIPRTRRVALACTIEFHTALAIGARPDVMSLVMIVLSVVFWVTNAISRP
jgi:hypothetical protein